MLHSYKSYISILESRETKIEKQKEKIRKFLKFEPIIDLVFDLIVSEDSTKGLKYTTWFCDKISKEVVEHLEKKSKDWSIGIDISKEVFEKYLKSGILDMKDKTDIIKERIKNSFTYFSPQTNEINTILDWLNSPIREEEQVDLSQYKTIHEAYLRAEEWHKNIKATGVIVKETGTVLMTFEDGYYWIDLETTSDRDEANAMGHCGTTNNGDTLYSLRRKQSPHVTSAIGSHPNGDGTDSTTIFQMKGRNNKKPTDKYYKYIIELLSYPNVSEDVKIINDFAPIVSFDTIEYLPSEDFHVSDLSGEQIKKLQEKNPKLIKNCGFTIKYKLFKAGYVTSEELIEGIEDLGIFDGGIHFLLDEWTDFECNIFKEDRNHSKCWQTQVLSYDANYDYYVDVKFDYNYNWKDLQPRVFVEVLEYLIKKKIIIEYNIQDYEGDNFEITKENASISPNKDDIWIKSPIGGVISLESLMSAKNGETSIKIDNGALIGFSSDELDDLRDEFDYGYCRAQEMADEGEAWETVTDAILSRIGNIVKGKEDRNRWSDNKVHIDLDFDYIIDIINASDGDVKVKSIIDTINSVGNIDTYDNELLIDVDVPYYGWQGTINSDDLSEEIINKIYDL